MIWYVVLYDMMILIISTYLPGQDSHKELNKELMKQLALQADGQQLTDELLRKISLQLQIQQVFKLRQREKAVHFMERRQDTAAGLPSEVSRHLCQLQAAMADCPAPADRLVVRQEFQWRRQDSIFTACGVSLFWGLGRAARLFCCAQP